MESLLLLHPKPFFLSNSNSPPISSFLHKNSRIHHALNSLPLPLPPHSAEPSHLLRLSTRLRRPDLTKAIHATLLKLPHQQHQHLLFSTYLNLGLLSYAHRIFLSLSSPTVISYSALISAFSKSHREHQAFHLFLHMLTSSTVLPNGYTYVAVLTACIQTLHLQFGLQLHAAVIKTAYIDSVFVANALMCLYSKCGSHDDMLKLFDEMPSRDIASWNTVLSGAVQELMYGTAFELFRDMQATDALSLDDFTLSTLLTACSGSASVMEGLQVHAHAVKVGLETELSVGNSLIGFYTNCGSLDNVVRLFEEMSVRDVITWTEMITAYMEFGLVNLALKIFDEMPEKNSVSYNALLAGFCQNGEGLKALDLFIRMVDEGLELTDFSLTSAINACSLLADYKVSKQIHGFATKFGFGSNACVEAALLDMYTRCGRMVDAKKMFCRWELEEFSSIVWTSMVCGYARNGQPDEAISLFKHGQSEGEMIDEVASTSMLGLCGTVGYHDMGKQIHCQVLKFGFQSNVGVGNAVVSMYFKCGNVDDAIKMFNSMPSADIVSWNTLISGYLMHRQGDRALKIWSKMQEVGIKPDKITFVLIIPAYRQTKLNLVDDCRSLFNSMRTIYHIEPTTEHYSSFISVLGHWGLLEEALETINKMPFEPTASVWRALLVSCRLHKNTMIGKWAAKNILALEPEDPSTYILVSNLYSASGRWDFSETVRWNMREKGFRKHPAQSWIICQKKIHSFYARDRSHSQEKDIYSGLEILILECLKAGYEPDTSFVLHEVEEHQKKNFLFYHSSKLAATYGILMTKPGKPIQIVKNILLCGDCHTFLKYASIVTKRDIFLRDSSGFHCFSNGQCSCNDYW
ncbi:pentatricopeptide repeat-containing protein At5g03800 isoform X2 [Lotus japonicus]|uniref:pentatricopeptide repeat-containing protein At5g03800 isoform X2 n=1 Tax=Lotus japonicus TaxID=34305 RepID=UPI002583C39A|nr:pentatricopeptide repeat-containing protein At5g03800 isoform X2 [Lotus japonicus]XP_057438201.1 pentatricopeptide repeat-containing protein At5g03800 isoform X2 [Lotus japonicus]XP_057438202.1 pentatricopeptide repeat-containing protein At5g03800 isoform X2 [Lotus japonicus]XP_057438203.1 pentatricopeptide repeat-containing protein At5g03800 isoform X2 [Lotus japonicus]